MIDILACYDSFVFLCSVLHTYLHIYNEITMKKILGNESTLLAQLGGLAIGESVTFPVERSAYVRTVCSAYGLTWGKRFSASVNREERTITATRKS